MSPPPKKKIKHCYPYRSITRAMVIENDQDLAGSKECQPVMIIIVVTYRGSIPSERKDPGRGGIFVNLLTSPVSYSF